MFILSYNTPLTTFVAHLFIVIPVPTEDDTFHHHTYVAVSNAGPARYIKKTLMLVYFSKLSYIYSRIKITNIICCLKIIFMNDG